MTTNDANFPRDQNTRNSSSQPSETYPPQPTGLTPGQLAEQVAAVPGQGVRKPAPGATEAYPLFLFAAGVEFEWRIVKLEKTPTGDLAIVFPDGARIELIDSTKLVEALEKKGNGAIPPLDDSLLILQQFIVDIEPAAGDQAPLFNTGHSYNLYDSGTIGDGIAHLLGLGDEDPNTAIDLETRKRALQEPSTKPTAGETIDGDKNFVGEPNDPPTATDDNYQLNYQVPFNQPALGGLLKNDADPNADVIAVSSTGNVSHGTLIVGSDGQFSYTPDQGFIGTDSFTYTITDGNGGTASALVTLEIGTYDNPPVAEPDSATTKEDTPVTIAADGVLANDSDDEGDVLTIVGNDSPSHGTVSLGADGSYVYTPDADFNGTDQFTYTVSDGNGGSASTTVTITVKPTNDVPVATDNTAEVIEGGLVATNVVIVFDRSGSMNNDPGVAGYSTRLAMTQAAIEKLLQSGDVANVLVVDFSDTASSSGWTSVSGAIAYVNGITAFGPTDYDLALTTAMAEFGQPHGAADRTVVYFVTDGAPNRPVGDIGLDAAETAQWENFLATNGIDRAFAVGIGSGVPNPSVDLEAVAFPNSDPNNPTYALYDVKLVDVTNESFIGHVAGNVIVDDSGFGVDTYGGDGAGHIQSIEIGGVVYTYDAGLNQITSINGTIPGSAFTTDTPSGGKLTFYFVDASGHQAGDYSYLSPGNVDADIDEVFPYVIVDVDGDPSTANLIIHVSDGDNRPPDAVDDSTVTDEETAVAITVLGNDTDLDGNPLTVTGLGIAGHGTVALGSDGTVLYTPDADFHGTDSFIYTITDDAGGGDTALVTVTVTGINDAPDAIDDAVSTAEETPIAITVLGNDTDVDGAGLTVIGNTDPSNGSVALGSDGVFTYTPNTDFNGTDSFIYTITDGNGGADTALVTVTVTGVNDAPDAIDDATTTAEETPIAITVLGNDTDVDGEGLTVIGNTDPSNGSVVLGSDGVLTYTPNVDFNGTDSFVYTITDGNGGADTALVTVTVTGVNDAPDAIDDAISTAEETPISITVLGNDTDVDGEGLTVVGNSDPSNGGVVLGSDGVFTYTPNLDFNGTDSFVYTITDGNGGADTALVVVTVTGVNDAPDALDDATTTTEETPIAITVLGNDTDVDGEGLSVIGNTDPSNGSVALGSDGVFTYTPNVDFDGTDSFVYTITDGNGGSDTALVSVTVTGANDVPDAIDDAVSTAEETPIAIAVLGNDTDVDGEGLSVVGNTDPSNGSVTLGSDGVFTYTPNLDFNGTDSFVYTITDGNGGADTALVTVTVTGVNDAPDALDDTTTTAEETPIAITVLGNDSDVDGEGLTVSGNTGPSNGSVVLGSDGVFTYTPDTDFNGTDSFIYTITDGNGGADTALVTITVTGVNDAPDAIDDAVSTAEETPIAITVLSNDTDVDGISLSVAGNTDPSNGSVVLGSDGVFTYTPDVDFNGTDSFIYTITDGNGSGDTALVTVTVTGVNDVPDAIDDSATTSEDNAVAITVLSNDTDVDGVALSVAGNTDPSNGSVVLGTDGVFTYTPDANFFGTDSFVYTITDGNGGADTALVTVTVTGVNDAPDALDDAVSTAEETPVAITVLGNDTDVDGVALTVVGNTNPSNGSVTLGSDGVFTYTPDTDFNGTDSFIYTITDGNGGSDTALVTVTVSGVNDAPDALDDAVSTAEETPIAITVLANDTDVDGVALSVTGNTAPSNGSATLGSDGVFTYTPNTNFFGTDSFVYTITDGNGGSDTALVIVTVTGVNDAPDALDDAVSTAEDNAVAITVLANDTDVDGVALSVIGNTAPSNGSVTLGTNGVFTYTPNTNFFGTDSFVYTITDGNGGADTALVTVTVTGVNDAPDAINDATTTNEDTPKAITVLANDTDVDGNALTVTGNTSPLHGSVTLGTNGVFTYTPTTNYFGTDSFVYTITDGNGGSDTATVTITVTGINDAPDAINDATTTNEDTPKAITVLANDTDVDGNALTVTGNTNPAHGSVTLATNGVFTYTPTANYFGTDSFVYTITDGNGGSDTATVTITVTGVNDAPDAINDATTTNEDTPKAITVLANDTDVDGNALTVTGNTSPLHGSVTLGTNGVFTYTPTTNYFGTDSFVYTITDGNGGSDTALVTITVAGVNDPPIANPDSATTPEDTATTVTVRSNDSDVENDPLTVTSVGTATHGTVTIVSGNVVYNPNANYNGTDSFSYTITDGNGGTASSYVSISVTGVNDAPDAVNDSASTAEDNAVAITVLSNDTDVDGNALTVTGNTAPLHGSVTLGTNGVFTYMPTTNYFGTDSFVYTITDGNGGSDTALVTVTVTGVNDAPDAINDSATTAEDNAVAITVLANDTDVDGVALSVIGNTAPANGSVTLGTAGVFTYTPNSNFFGTDSFVYTITDGNGGSDTALVTVTVTGVNDPPVANPDSATTPEDTGVTISVRGNDSDPESNPLTVINLGTPGHGTVTIVGGNVVYNPTGDYNGTDSFTYTITDGNGGTASTTVTVTVTGVNDPPIANNDTATTTEDQPAVINVPANDSDPEGNPLTIVGAGAAANGTVAIEGLNIRYTPVANFYGTDSFVYTISDGNGGTASATVTVTVTSVNDPPIAANDSAIINEDVPATITVLGNDTDIDGGALTVTHLGIAQHGTVSVTTGGTVVYTPTGNYFGTDSFTYTINDGLGGTSSATVTVTVTGVNDPPVANPDTATVVEDTAVTISVRGNDSDVENNPLTVSSIGTPGHGTVTIVGGNVVYNPTANYNGTDSFTYTITDGNGGTASTTVTVTVTGVNDPPVANPDSATTAEDTATTITVRGNDADIDGNTLTVTNLGTPSSGTVSIVGGNVVYTPSANYNGTASFTYTITDGNGGSASSTVTVSVTGVNDAPVANPDAATTAEDTPVTISVRGNDSDVDGNTLTVTNVGTPTSGTVSIVGGNVVYTPTANYNGTASFTYTITDGNGGTASSTVTVSVTGVNDAPVANPDTATTSENTAISISVRGNDSDPDGNTLTLTNVGSAAHGSVSITTSGTVRYTPTSQYSGTDSFTYTITDGNGGTASSTVTVTVTGVNDPPVANPDSATTAEDTPVTISVRNNDTDPDFNTLTITSVGAAGHGTVSIVSGKVVYTPTANYFGTDSFTYRITDGNGGATSSTTVTVTVTGVNDPPIANPDSATIAEDTPITISVRGNDVDVDGNTLTVTNVGTPGHGTVTIVGGNVVYNPTSNYSGTDSFTYAISDGNGGTSSSTATVTVTGVNDPPIANPDVATTAEDTSTTISVRGNDTDADGNTLTITNTGTPGHGTVTVVGGNVVYNPTANYNGTDSFTYTITDGNGGATASTTVTVTVTSVDDLPSANNNQATIYEGGLRTYNLVIIVDTSGSMDDASGVAGYPTRMDLAKAAVQELVSNGNIVNVLVVDFASSANTSGWVAPGAAVSYVNALDADGNTNYDAAINLAMAQYATPHAAADNTVVYFLTDGVPTRPTGSVGLNATETAAWETFLSTNGIEAAYAVAIGTGISNPDPDLLAIAWPANEQLTPLYVIEQEQLIDTLNDTSNGLAAGNVYGDNDGFGVDSFGGDGAGQIKSIMVDGVTYTYNSGTNQITSSNPAILGSTLVVMTAEGGKLTFYFADAGTHEAGDYVYLSAPNEPLNVTEVFNYAIADSDGDQATANLTINVVPQPLQDPPHVVADIATVNKNNSVTIDVRANDVDLNDDTLTITSLGAPSNGSVTVVGGNVVYTPTAGYTGTASFTYTVTDGNGGGTDSGVVTVSVTAFNNAPVAVSDSRTMNEDGGLQTISVRSNDSDADGNTLTLLSVGAAAHGTVSISSGTARYTPTANYAGTDSFTYTITDGNGGSATATVTVTMNAVNDAPAAVNDAITTYQGQAIQYGLFDNDVELDGDHLTIVSMGSIPSSVGSLSLGADGQLIYTPNASFTGTRSFTYTVTDGNGGGTDAATVTVNVTAAPGLAGDLVLNEIGMNSAAAGTLANGSGINGNVTITGKDYIEIRNLSGSAITDGTIAELDIEIVGPSGTKITIDLDTMNSHDDVPAGGYLVLYNAVDGDGKGVYAIYTSAGVLADRGDYTYPGDWGFGDSAGEKLAVNLIHSGTSIDAFEANDVSAAQLAGGPNWFTNTYNTSSGQAAARALIGGTLLDNSSFTGLVGDQDATLATLGLTRPDVDGLTASANLADGISKIFARVFSSVADGGTVDTNTAADWTVTNAATQGGLNNLSSTNPQDSTDNFNPLQGAGSGSGHGSDAGQSVLEASTNGSLTGGLGHDYLYGATGNNTLDGGVGNDFVFGHSGNDILLGGKGADLLIDVDGKDILRGGTGDDILIADATRFGKTVPGSDQGDLLIGDDIIDTAAAASAVSGNDVIYGGASADMIFGDNAVVPTASQAAFLADPAGYYNGLSNADRKTFLIDNQNNNGGADAIDGGGGNDIIFGGGGEDQLIGGLGNDIIHGGTGSDHLDGGTGSDKFLYVTGDIGAGTQDKIYNFQTGAGGDSLDVADLLSGYSAPNKNQFIQVTDDGSGNALVRVDANGATGGSSFVDVAVLVGVSPTSTVDDLIANGNLIVTH